MSSKYIFIGGIWIKNEEQEIIRKSLGNAQIAANVFQTNIIDGIEQCINEPVTILSSKFLGSFPKLYKEMIIHSKKFNHTDIPEHTDFDVGFLNLPYIKHYSRFIHLKKYIRNILNSCSDEKVYVIGYSMSYAIVESLLYAKKINKKINTCLIVPDLPEYMSLGRKRNPMFRFLKEINMKKMYSQIKEIDSFVVLTKYMYSALKVNRPYTVVEGIASAEVTESFPKADEKKKLVYTGTLNIKYGILELVNAFCRIQDDELELVICGKGEGEAYIKNKMLKDHRIKYLGMVDNQTAQKIQSQAYLLINPRNNNEEFTKFSFPSKTMEYMASGRPILMYKLAGIPDEYDEYLLYVKDNDLEQSIRDVISMKEQDLEFIGRKGKQFVLDNKNEKEQAMKIVQLLRDITA